MAAGALAFPARGRWRCRRPCGCRFPSGVPPAPVGVQGGEFTSGLGRGVVAAAGLDDELAAGGVADDADPAVDVAASLYGSVVLEDAGLVAGARVHGMSFRVR